jgi:DNA-binding NarL/FixJ family response regulator
MVHVVPPAGAEATHVRESLRSSAPFGNPGGVGGRPVPSLYDQRRVTPREREVLTLVANGVTNKEGAHRLGISIRTFEVHRAHLMDKLGARNAADLVRMALSGRYVSAGTGW